jgi:hypothetical protein
MIAEWLAALEATALARELRGSVWIYPLVNAGHVAGVALLVGAIVPLDLRLLGLWPAVPLAPLWQVLRRTAGAGLLLAIGCGALLFTAQATDYAASRLFIAKMAVVATAIANALLLRRMVSGEGLRIIAAGRRLPAGVRLAGGISMIGWLTALILGRLIGYF